MTTTIFESFTEYIIISKACFYVSKRDLSGKFDIFKVVLNSNPSPTVLLENVENSLLFMSFIYKIYIQKYFQFRQKIIQKNV